MSGNTNTSAKSATVKGDAATVNASKFEDDWESTGEDEEDESDEDAPSVSPDSIEKMLDMAEKVNELLKALMSHPQLDKSDPTKSPRPIFFVADFVRRTYLEDLLPVMPRDAVIKSSRLANEYLFGYTDANPVPTEAASEYLNNPQNWSSQATVLKALMDSMTRNMTICMAINDSRTGAMMLGGPFDWVRPVNIKAAAQRLL